MRVLVLCLSVGAISYSLAGYAQAIHKCMGPEGIAYQSVPCASGAGDVVIASLGSARIESSVRPDPPAAAPARRDPATDSRRIFWRTSISIGMSDDEVLSLPSWGRPSAITRSKSNRIWYEEWIYRWRLGGTSRLSFANGRLTAVGTAATATGVEAPVSLTLR
jgi:hypothetical protein